MKPLTLTSFIALTLALPAQAVIYSGSLVSGAGLTGTEQWSSDASLSWTVTDEDPGGAWLYSYTLVVANKDISHVTFEVSDTFELSNITGDVGDPGNILDGGSLDTYGPGLHGNSDPGIPDTLQGIKFNTTGNTTNLSWSIYSDRVPVWGDFYAKDGKSGGPGGGNDVYLYNTGFTAGDTDPDAPAADGSVDNHILRPDSLSDPEGPSIPEPQTTLLGMIGLMMIFRRRSRDMS